MAAGATCTAPVSQHACVNMHERKRMCDGATNFGQQSRSPFAGPIASCDGVGDTNASLLMRTARADGILLKPDRPAVAIDALWIGDILKAGR